MVEVLPLRHLTDEDAPLFGNLNVALAKLGRSGIPIPQGIVITPPNLHLKATLSHFDFGHKEIFEQSLTLVKKEIEKTPTPEALQREAGKNRRFLLNGEVLGSVKKLWLMMLFTWIEQVKQRLWKEGFYQGITEGLDPQVVIFIKHSPAKPKPADLKKIDELEKMANEKLFLAHKYEWIIDDGVKLIKVLPFTPMPVIPESVLLKSDLTHSKSDPVKTKSTVKVFLDLSNSLVIEEDIDGVYIQSEWIFDLDKPTDSWEKLVFKIVETAITYPDKPVLVKLADKSEGMGKVRGTLRLLHQKSLFDPLIDALDFARHKKNLNNIHIVAPFVRTASELMQIKRDLAVKKLMRKKSLQIWMEVATPENIINLEEYLLCGLDGVVINLDELAAHFSGFDHREEELTFYKKQVSGLLKFLEDGVKLLHKPNRPFLAVGSILLDPEVLQFLVHSGVYGVVVERYEAHSAKNLLHQAEAKHILTLGAQ